MVSVALQLLRAGFWVFPVGRDKRPLTRRGFKDATDDARRIERWWDHWPDANPAIDTGRSGLVVIDSDTRDGFANLCAELGHAVPDTFTVRTSQGSHYYFRAPDEQQIGNRAKVRGFPVDVRGSGGYVVGPGAIHASGEVYTTTNTNRPQPLPGWLVEVLRPQEHRTGTPAPRGMPQTEETSTVTPAAARAAYEAAVEDVRDAAEGQRNDTLNVKAHRLGRMVAGGLLGRDEVADGLLSAALDAGLEHGEATNTIESGLGSGQEHPRQAAPEPESSGYEQDVAAELYRLKVRQDARDRFKASERETLPPFDADWLGKMLERDPEPPFRVEGLIPADASTLIVAQRKTGKTTLLLNLARSLLTGQPLLGSLDVQPTTGPVAILNFEVSGHTLARWASDAMVPHDRLMLVNLRGRRNPLGDERDRESLAQLLRQAKVETLIVDPFGRAYSGQSQNDAGEVGPWLVTLDQFAREQVGARDLVLAAHAGWNGERTRGSSALEDWADSVITLTRGTGADDSRYLRAEGRDVLMDEDRLGFDQSSRTLTLTAAGSRQQATGALALDDAKQAVLAWVRKNDGCSGEAMRKGVDARDGLVLQARRELVESGHLIETRRKGSGGGNAYSVAATATQPRLSLGDI